MKKTLILTGILALSLSMPSFAAQTDDSTNVPQPPRAHMEQGFKKPDFNSEEMAKKKAEFESRLQLTDEQKAKAKELRENGRKKIEPLIKEIETKKQEIETVKLTKISEQAQKERIEAVQKEIREIHKKLHEQRMQNMKDFEAILTDAQLSELKKMKEEGRKKFEKNHRGCNCGCNKGPKEYKPQPFQPKTEAK